MHPIIREMRKTDSNSILACHWWQNMSNMKLSSVDDMVELLGSIFGFCTCRFRTISCINIYDLDFCFLSFTIFLKSSEATNVYFPQDA